MKLKKSKDKYLSLIRIITGFLCVALFATFAISALSVFEWVPWYDFTGDSQLIMVVLWLPESAICVIHIALLFASRTLYRMRIILICINALYIPLYYLAGFLEFSGRGILSIIAICSAVTTLLFAISHIKSIFDKTV